LKQIVSLILVIFIGSKVFSQDTLPRFTLTERGDKVTISWVNPFPNLIQLNIQRSYDSLKNFSTVYSATSPELPQNGFTDNKPPTNRIYYRIFYVLEGGSYFFSRAKRAGVGGQADYIGSSRDINSPSFLNVNPSDKRMVTIKINDAVFKKIPAYAFRSFRDSILRQTRDTLYAINDTLIGVHPFVAREIWRASPFVYANRDGYINISVPAVAQKKYHIKFFEENGTSLFEIRNVKESPLILDKSSFVHAGWFLFELYEDNVLKEKNKFYLPKDF
jgi:hypothetical protein